MCLTNQHITIYCVYILSPYQKKMIKLYWLEYTYYDHPWKYSLVLYCGGCNLKCYWCHNSVLAWWKYKDSSREDIISVKTCEYANMLSQEEVEMAVKNNMLDMIILCGGEFLLHDVENIKETIEYIKYLNPNVLIRIDTNWSFPDKVQKLSNRWKVDGFAIDIKWPYWNVNYHSEISKVIGLSESYAKNIFPKMTESINIVKEHEYTLYRTVIYPIVKDDNYFKEIKNYVTKNLWKPHSFSTFVNI